VVWIASIFLSNKADDADVLTHGKEDNAVRRKKTPQDMLQFSRGGVLAAKSRFTGFRHPPPGGAAWEKRQKAVSKIWQTNFNEAGLPNGNQLFLFLFSIFTVDSL